MGSFLFRQKRPLIIAGPCSAESPEQLFATAEELARVGGVDLLRAGLWKPRTRPDSFEGVGEVGLSWLSEAKRHTGLPIATEIASARHAELALRAGVDVVWIGARTTVNPFLVQEIADAVAGSDVGVLIKNPMHPDIELWSGAVARLERAGIDRSRIGLVHRGFSVSSYSGYRNDPMWHLLLDIQHRHPDLTLLADPSHISGRRDLIAEVAQMAANLNVDGLMIECHHRPEAARSDADQQITPQELGKILATIQWRHLKSADKEYIRELSRYRSEIDRIDHALFDLLSQRMQISDLIGTIKRQNDVMILQRDRWAEIMERILAQADEWNLSEEFLRTILEAIHIESIRHQNV